jgi:hypothetical protein
MSDNKTPPDPEIDCMQAVAVQLEPLTAEERGRVLRWLISYLRQHGGIKGLTGDE